jgi:hypothetical protein
MRKYFQNNGLSIIFLFFFLLSLIGQVITGFKEYNTERKERHQSAVSVASYFQSGHFLEATFENWESEFLQMGLFVVLTIWLRQKGSSESKASNNEEVDREPSTRRHHVPWPVKKGGWILALYKRSLSITLFLLFAASFVAHWLGSCKDFNEEQLSENEPLQTAWQYLGNQRFWFESFQNWQSEFLSVFAIIWLSIYLRQKGSPQSKPVDAPHSKTGE